MDNKVILVQGDGSNWYEQAIFIVRPNMSKGNIPVDLVREAEKIINGHLALGTNIYRGNPAAAAKPQQKRPTESPAAKARTNRKNEFNTVINSAL